MWRAHRLARNPYVIARYSMSLHKPFQIRPNKPITTEPTQDFATLLQHSSKKGMRVTWIGFVSNVGLTISKGTAGVLMNSASLLADATHSFSDLLSDFVTLYTFKMSRKVPDSIYPYGYGKYETMGSLSVSALLMAGGAGIGFHSFDLLLNTIDGTHNTSELDPNAAWFALGSVLVKEWLYRITLKVGRSERSDVLIANAWHHRSDAYSSFVALMAIGGTYAGIPIFDPLGGILVSCMILKSGSEIMWSSSKELLDKSISESELDEIKNIVASVKDKNILDFYSIRGRKFGPFHHLDLTLQLNPNLPIYQAHAIEQSVRLAIKQKCCHVQEVIIHIDAEKQSRHF
ncbi:cation efflux protein [Thamnidium elegans]|nr:cation efflux protein [Thamnidium elegans]